MNDLQFNFAIYMLITAMMLALMTYNVHPVCAPSTICAQLSDEGRVMAFLVMSLVSLGIPYDGTWDFASFYRGLQNVWVRYELRFRNYLTYNGPGTVMSGVIQCSILFCVTIAEGCFWLEILHPRALSVRAIPAVPAVQRDERRVWKPYECGVCFDRDTNICLIPCGHCFCSQCSARLTKCPNCRADIRIQQPLYFN